MTIQDDAVAQCEQALKNIEAALAQANAGFADVVRVHYLMTNAADFERCWPAMGKAFGEVRPAATMMVVGLADPRMKIEIEVTALRKSVAKAKTAPRPKRKAKSKAKAARRKK
jgi:enamine deaminase RidA (YjgF/YER057c/UK114 family)